MARIPGRAEAACIAAFCRALETNNVRRRHTFDFLRGDPTPRRPKGSLLPVDAYFAGFGLVVEYMGSQHFAGNPLMDRRAGRAEQRSRYQALRSELLPKHGLKLIRVRYDEALTPQLVREKLRTAGIRVPSMR